MPYLNRIAPVPEPIDCRILTAALDLFVEHGFHNVSVHDVQKQANVSIGSIYNHFGGKEGIAQALYTHLLKEFEEMIEAVVAETINNRQRCDRIIQQLFQYTESKRNIIEYIFHAKHREFIPEEQPVYRSIAFVAMRDIVQQGIKLGEIRDGDPWVVSTTIFGGAIRMIQLRLDGLVDKPLMHYYDEVIDCMWRGMEPQILTEAPKKISAA